MDAAKLTERFEAALVYATNCLHTNQTRKVSGVPTNGRCYLG